MADFEQAFQYVMNNEDRGLTGRVTPEPKGGKARFGINSVAHPEADTDGFYEMPNDQALTYAQQICKYDYWQPIGGYDLADQTIANKFLDLAFNMSPKQATKLIQAAVNASRPLKQQIAVDGLAGAMTVAAINAADPVKLLASTRAQATEFYKHLAQNNPVLAPSLSGWLNRLNS